MNTNQIKKDLPCPFTESELNEKRDAQEWAWQVFLALIDTPQRRSRCASCAPPEH